RRYISLYPEDFTGLTSLAGIQINMGELPAARNTLERVLLLEPDSTEVQLLLGRVYHRLGNFEAAEAAIRNALASAASPAARLTCWASLQVYYRTQGRIQDAIAAMDERLAIAETIQPPSQIIALRLNNIDEYLEAG